MARENVAFRNNDGSRLSAVMELPDGDPKGFALFAHCFTCTKNLSAVRRISQGLTEEGIGVLSFDFTGLGESEGEFATAGFAHQTEDLIAAAGFLEQHVGKGPQLLVGHSLGGTATLYAARRLPSVLGVATIGSPADPAHVTKLFECDVEEIERRGEADVSMGGRALTISKCFVDDLKAHPPEEWLPELRTRLLLFHSPVDTIVDISNAQRIFMSVKHPKSFVSLDQADHLLSRPRDARFVAGVLAAWAASFLDSN